MNEHVYKQIKLTVSSKTSIEDAVQSAITKSIRDASRFALVSNRREPWIY
jgi:flavin-binding protein dodecin